VPNPIKYSASAQTLALKKGNFWIGTGDVGKGPTSTTDYWNGISPSGGYTIYLNKGSNGPAIYTVGNDAALISISNRIAEQTFETAAAALAWFATQTDKMVFNEDYPAIVTDGLVLNLDAGFTPSYPTTGTTWYDVSPGGNNGTLTNGPTFNSSNDGSIVFDGSDDYVNLPDGLLSGTGDFTIIQWVQCDGAGIGTTFGNYGAGTLQFGWSASYVFLWLDNSSAYASPGNFTTAITMIAGRRIGTTTNYLKNGTVLTTGSSGASIGSSSANFRIGTNTSTSEQYNGKIYTTMVYNRGLSNTEILQNYNATKSRFGL
jgi:hypothetical protein